MPLTTDDDIETHPDSINTRSSSINTEPDVDIIRVIDNRESDLACPICSQVYTARKSLLRHVRTTHDRHTPYLCASCGESFARKDILRRHLTTQHGNDYRHTQCEVCHKWIRPRALRAHMMSDACRATRLLIQANVTYSDIPRSTWATLCASVDPSMPPYPSTCADPLLTSIALWVKLKPWGKGSEALWLIQSGVQSLSIEAFMLNCLAYQSVSRALRNYDPRQDHYLFYAVLVLSMTEFWMSGWEASRPHRLAAINLERCIEGVHGHERVFAGTDLFEAFTTVLRTQVGPEDVMKCWRLYRGGITLVRNGVLMMMSRGPDAAAVVGGLSREEYIQYFNSAVTSLARLASTIGAEDLKGEDGAGGA